LTAYPFWPTVTTFEFEPEPVFEFDPEPVLELEPVPPIPARAEASAAGQTVV
jgi:hypothetical protein